MKPLPLSVIILVHRNDANLRRTLQSVSFAQDIVIFDNDSGVEWKEFKDLPLQIIKDSNPITDFSATRNALIKEAKNDWVLFLDSDEEVAAPAVPKVAAVLASSAQAAAVTRSDIFLGKKILYGEAGQQQIIRLGRKNTISFSGTVHEIAQVDGELFYSNIELLHHAHPSISEFISDVSGYAKMVAATKKTSLSTNLLELLFFPPIKLMYGLFIQGGIMDGWRGVVYAVCMSLHSLLVRIYRYELITNTKKPSQS